MTDIWDCASKAWDLIAEAKKSIDLGEVNADRYEFMTARLKLNQAKEFLNDIMSETMRKKAADAKAVSATDGKPEIIRSKEISGLLHSLSSPKKKPMETPFDDPQLYPLSPDGYIAELP